MLPRTLLFGTVSTIEAVVSDGRQVGYILTVLFQGNLSFLSFSSLGVRPLSLSGHLPPPLFICLLRLYVFPSSP